MQRLLLGFLLGLLVAPAFGQQNFLRVLNPQGGFTQQGTIEEATLTVRPKGAYMEYGLYLTFSGRGTSFATNTQLEVQLMFGLPAEAVVTESWLWIGDDIIRGELLDVWTASSIYESIVQRRQDPSILFKRSATQYELRVYPMLRSETRRVKITYLMPTTWTAATVTAQMPTHITGTSRYEVDYLRVVVLDDDTWKRPRFAEFSDRIFARHEDAERGAYALAGIPGWMKTPVALVVDSPLKNGAFLSRFSQGSEGWYQLVLVPEEVLDLKRPRRVLVMLDYDAARTNLSLQDLIVRVRTELSRSLAPQDSFNVVVSQSTPHLLRSDWQPATSASIQAVFDELSGLSWPGYSVLPAMLRTGYDFVQGKGQDAYVLLVSSADNVGAATQANALLQELRTRYPTLPPTYMVDVANTAVQNYNIGGRWYRGNEYLYQNLAQFSQGQFILATNVTAVEGALRTHVGNMNAVLSAYDVAVKPEDGFTFGRQTLTGSGRSISLSQPTVQIGRYHGTSDFRVEVAGLLAQQPVGRVWSMASSDVHASDSTLKQYWYGGELRTLEAQSPPTNAVIAQIVAMSLEQHVLSRYSAFLALEPQQGGVVCHSCRDETKNLPTDVEDEQPTSVDIELQAYPNPFREDVTLRVRFARPVRSDEVRFEVFDILGRRVRTLQPGEAQDGTTFSISWDGQSDDGERVAAGTYFFSVKAGSLHRTLALTRL